MPDPAARRSLRRQLLFVVLAVVAGTWAATTVSSWLDARHELGELLDAHLAQSASLLVAQAGHDADEIDVEHSPQLHAYGRRVAFQLWENGATLRVHSANAPNTRLSATLEGFSDANAGGHDWRVFSAWDTPRRYLVQVGERREVRDKIVATAVGNLLRPLVVALPLLGVLIWFGIDRALRPIAFVNRQIERRAPDNLAPLDAGDAPAEVAPLVASLNRLFDRVRASIDNERRFTADAAHELRTPLAALRAQAQVARGARSDDERDRALDSVVAGCDRATHLVDQLLTLARLDPEAVRAEREPCDLAELARVAVAEQVPAALAKSIDVELDVGGPVEAPADPRLLRILLRNLLDNAVRYGFPGSSVRVRAEAAGGRARLVVSDEGPGVPPDERERLGQRFHRLLGTGEPGSGLGLSIVRRIAEVHGATVAFADTRPGVGLTVSVDFAPVGAAVPHRRT